MISGASSDEQYLEDLRNDCRQHRRRSYALIRDTATQLYHPFKTGQVDSSFIKQTSNQLCGISSGLMSSSQSRTYRAREQVHNRVECLIA